MGEGAQSVAASTIQEHSGILSPHSMKVTVASMDAVDQFTQSYLHSIFTKLSTVSQDISKRDTIVNEIFGLISIHHHQRLLNRLRSSRWNKPTYLSRTHKKPLYADYANLIHRVQLIYSQKSERSVRVEIEERLSSLVSVLENFEQVSDANEEIEGQQQRTLIRACYDLCKCPAIMDYYKQLQEKRPTAQIRACLKTLQQTEKIAAYYRIPLTLVDIALTYPDLFKNIELKFLAPYDAVPLEIAYQSWATSMHVHAEINLVVHHDMHDNDENMKTWLKPRCIGASKYLCFLCYLFIQHHGVYFPSATHGACYDQWTVPNLSEYTDHFCQRYREILHGMHKDICEMTKNAKRRPEPMTSYENLLEGLV